MSHEKEQRARQRVLHLEADLKKLAVELLELKRLLAENEARAKAIDAEILIITMSDD